VWEEGGGSINSLSPHTPHTPHTPSSAHLPLSLIPPLATFKAALLDSVQVTTAVITLGAADTGVAIKDGNLGISLVCLKAHLSSQITFLR